MLKSLYSIDYIYYPAISSESVLYFFSETNSKVLKESLKSLFPEKVIFNCRNAQYKMVFTYS